MEQAVEKLRGMLWRMGIEGEVIAREDDERITLEIEGPDSGLVIGRQGATLDALQYLVNKMVGREGFEHKPVSVDAEGYRARHAESLVELAHRLADKAIKTKQPVIAQSMSPGDRRIIHLALVEIAGVSTRSEGEGIERRLVVIPEVGVSAPEASVPEEK